ncbi:hypothetical protein Tco_1296408 [Tanacetum coccineum]
MSGGVDALKRYKLWKPYLRSMMEEEDMEAVSLGTNRKENVLATCFLDVTSLLQSKVVDLQQNQPAQGQSTESYRRLYCHVRYHLALNFPFIVV